MRWGWWREAGGFYFIFDWEKKESVSEGLALPTCSGLGNEQVAFAGLCRCAVVQSWDSALPDSCLSGWEVSKSIWYMSTRCCRRKNEEGGVILALEVLELASVWWAPGSLRTSWLLWSVDLWSISALDSLYHQDTRCVLWYKFGKVPETRMSSVHFSSFFSSPYFRSEM